MKVYSVIMNCDAGRLTATATMNGWPDGYVGDVLDSLRKARETLIECVVTMVGAGT